MNTLDVRPLDEDHCDELELSMANGYMSHYGLLARRRQVGCTQAKHASVVDLYGEHFTTKVQLEDATWLFYHYVYDVFDGNHRTATMKRLITSKTGLWTLKTLIPVCVHKSELPDRAAVRLGGLVNEFQTVAKGGSYGDQLSFLLKTLNRGLEQVATVPPVELTAEEKKLKPSRIKQLIDTRLRQSVTAKRAHVEDYVHKYFQQGAQQLKSKLTPTELTEFTKMFDMPYVKAKLMLAEFLAPMGVDALCALERAAPVKAAQAWELMVPNSDWVLVEMSKLDRANLFPQTRNAMKVLHQHTASLLTTARSMFGKETKETVTEVAQLSLDVARKAGLRILTWHLAYFAQRVWKRRVRGDEQTSGFNQLSLAKLLAELYLNTQSEEEDVQNEVNKTLESFWQDVQFLYVLFVASKEGDTEKVKAALLAEEGESFSVLMLTITKNLLQVESC
jgi:hypothetical protein